MKYFFILGNHPQISLAEIMHVLISRKIRYGLHSFSSNAAIIETNTTIPLQGIGDRLGGTIKAGTVIEHVGVHHPSDTYHHLITCFPSKPQEKTVFGISAYTLAQTSPSNKAQTPSQKDIQKLGLSIKKELKTRGGVVRFVAPQKGNNLSSVVVAKNHLIENGNAEYVLLYNYGTCLIGRTEWVQPFEQYSQRDWDRPAKSMDVGMLPPKLAQVMINVSGVAPTDDATLLDPFCGLGTILQESWLMGFRTLIGSDIEEKNIKATEKNLLWLEKQHPKRTGTTSLRLFQSDVRHLAKKIDPHSIDCIVTEPYLGPIVNARTPQGRINTIQRELSQLYIEAFEKFAKILKPRGVVSIVFPVWRVGNKTIDLPIIDTIAKLGFQNETIPATLAPHLTPNPRESFLYSRPGQTVMRELFVWRKGPYP